MNATVWGQESTKLNGLFKANNMKWLLCINNDGFMASLEIRKLYEQVPDPMADKLDMVRIIDESGEDYLYKKGHFMEMPAVVNPVLDEVLLKIA